MVCKRIRKVWLLAGVTAIALTGCARGDGSTQPTNTEMEDHFDGGQRRTRTFTTQQDWNQGETSGLNTDGNGTLQMNAGLSVYETPYIWVPNSSERSVSKIDTKTLDLLGTFPLVNDDGVDCYNPSRTTVDLAGNVWVGCRGNASYINRDAVEEGDVPQRVDNKVVKLAKEDGRVLLSIQVGQAPRALALDANNHLWVGASVDDTVWEIDGDTGHCYRGEGGDCDAPAIAVDDFPYGMAIDQRAHLWLVNNRIPTSSPDLLTEIDTATGAILGVYGPYLRNGCNDLYGIAIDPLNDIWLGGFDCDDAVKVKGVTGINPSDGRNYVAGQMIDAYDAAGETSRGVAIDLDGNVWVATSGSNAATKLNGSTGKFLAVVNAGNGPIGVGVDAWGNAWVVNRGSDSVHRVNGLDVTQKDQIIVGSGPYTYSDMLGMALRTITHRAEGFSWWRTTIDSNLEDPVWETVSWDAFEPNKTDVRLRMRCAASETELATAPWGEFMDDPGSIDCAGQGGRFGEVEARFYSLGTTASPVLESLTVYWQ